MTVETLPLRVRHGALHFFVRETLKRLRVTPELASQTADAMVGANLAGDDADGVAWLPDLARKVSTRHVNTSPDMKLVASSGGTAVLDGDNGPGPAVARRAMTEAITGANRHGVGSTAVRHGNRLGSAGYAASLALPHQMAGIAMAGDPQQPQPEEQPSATHPVALGIAVPTAETAAPLVLNLRFQEGGDRDVALALALEFLISLGGAALPAEFTAEPRPEPVHGGAGQLFVAFRVRAFAPWAGFRNGMVERLTHLRRARIDYPGQEAAAIEEERRTRGIPLRVKTSESLRQLAYQLGMNEIWDGLGK
jgi:LDH2 family malate/lactate/ureidoglycolate dehydrogenase